MEIWTFSNSLGRDKGEYIWKACVDYDKTPDTADTSLFKEDDGGCVTIGSEDVEYQGEMINHQRCC